MQARTSHRDGGGAYFLLDGSRPIVLANSSLEIKEHEFAATGFQLPLLNFTDSLGGQFGAVSGGLNLVDILGDDAVFLSFTNATGSLTGNLKYTPSTDLLEFENLANISFGIIPVAFNEFTVTHVNSTLKPKTHNTFDLGSDSVPLPFLNRYWRNIYYAGEMKAADIIFTGGGLPYAGISVVANTTETAIAASGTKVQYTLFDTDDAENNADADHTNDHIVIQKAGKYRIVVSIHADSVAGAGAEFNFQVYINNGDVALANVHAHRSFSGGGGEIAAIGLSGIASLLVNDTIELWVTNDTNTQNIILTDVTLSLIQVGS